MGIKNHEEFWMAGARVYFKRNDDGATTFPLLDLGVVRPGGITPSFEVTKAEMKDSSSGIVRTVEETVTEVAESYQITLGNLNPDNLSLAFLAEAPEAVNVSATPKTNVTQLAGDCHAGHLFQIRDSDGEPARGLASVDGVSVGSDDMVEDTDFEVVDLDKGLIRIIAAGDIETGDVLIVDYTQVARTGKRMVKPQTASTVQGMMFLYFGRENNARVTVREAEVSLSPAGFNMPEGDYSEITLEAKVLSDITETEQPAGILESIKGSLPSVS